MRRQSIPWFLGLIMTGMSVLFLSCAKLKESQGYALKASAQSSTSIKRVFVSTSTHNANFGGIAGADTFCNAQATTANLGGKWVAWLSVTAQNAKDHVQDVGPWYLVDKKTLVAESMSELTSGNALRAAINQDQHGNTPAQTDFVNGGVDVWTGTLTDGTTDLAFGNTCSDWTNGNGAFSTPDTGHTQNIITGNSDTGWSNDGTMAASNQLLHLYCFEQ